MTVELRIQDGSPQWYFSPAIWVVPGSDPNGPPGPPVAGQTAFVWARVENLGDEPASEVRVDFYWANPALQVLRSNANPIGSAYVDVPGGGAQEVLCLVPWLPVVVNGGHECLVAVANHPADPLPTPLPDAFDPPSYRQVAQRNLTVLSMGAGMMSLILTVGALPRENKDITVTAETGGKLDERTLLQLGLGRHRPAKAATVQLALSARAGCQTPDPQTARHSLQLHLPKGSSAPVHLTVLGAGLAADEYQLIHVVERSGDRILGGLGLVVVAEHKESRS